MSSAPPIGQRGRNKEKRKKEKKKKKRQKKKKKINKRKKKAPLSLDFFYVAVQANWQF